MAGAQGQGDLSESDYQALASFRLALREFLAFSAAAAQGVGLPPQQYQALLIIRATPKDHPATVGLIAEQLLVAPHTAAELVGRLKAADLITAEADLSDRRRSILTMTSKATELLSQLARAHFDEVRHLAPQLISTLRTISGVE